jgi:DNA-binding NarL/FixJ family response regulator
MESDSADKQARARVFLVDDHAIVRDGLTSLINREPDLTVCGDAEDATSALRKIQALRPDIVLVDISLAGPDGLDLLKAIRVYDHRIPVLVLSMHDESHYAERALRAGASGYIMKHEATEKVLVAIRRILGGDVYLSERLASKMLHQLVGGGAPAAPQSPIADLTDRELEVFRRIGEGRGTRQIAEELQISVKTVESYQARIKDKLSLKNARELVQRAVKWADEKRI